MITGLAVAFLTTSASAATLTWGTSGTGGSGSWDTTTSGWWNGSSNVVWNNTTPDSAVFAGTAGTVTLAAPITVGGMTFNTDGYTLTGGTLTIAGGTAAFTLGSGVSATIGSVISGTAVFQKTDTGTLTLTGANTYTGATTVSAGRLINVLPSTPWTQTSSGVTVASGAGQGLDFSNQTNLSAPAVANATGPNSTFLNTSPYSSSGVLVALPTGATLNAGQSVTLPGTNYHLDMQSDGNLVFYNGGTPLWASNTFGSNYYVTMQSDGNLVVYRPNSGGAAWAAGTSGANRALVMGANGRLAVTAAPSWDNIGTVANSGTVELASTNVLAPYAGGVVLTAGGITGSGVINKTGTGNVAFSIFDASGNSVSATGTNGLNAFNGVLNIQAGKLISEQQTGTTPVGSGQMQVTISSGATLDITGGGFRIDTLSGTGSVTSSTGLNNPVLVVGANNGSSTFYGAISGANLVLTKLGTGTQTLTGVNSYTGATSINAGTFVLAGAGQLGSGAYASAISNAGALVVATSANQTLSGVVSGAGSISKSGAGTLSLTNGSNSFTGGVSLTGGILAFVSGGLGASGTVSLGGGTLQWTGANTQDVSSRLSLVDSSITTLDIGSNNVTFSSGFGGGSSGSLIKTGAGTLTLSGSNAYTGATTISGGTLALSGAGDISSGSAAVVSIAVGAALDISAASGNRTIGALSGGDGTSRVLLGGNTLRSVVASGDAGFAGVISGSGGFTKAGANRLELANLQAFTGAATIDAGSLLLASGTALASASRIYVASGATLETYAGQTLTISSGQTLGGYGIVNGNLALQSGGTLSPGGSVGTLYGDYGGATWNGGMHYLFEVNDASGTSGGPNGWDLFSTSGDLTLSAGLANQIVIDLTSLNGSISGSAANFDPSVNYAWKFAVAGNPISTFNPTWFTVNSSGFQNLAGNPERFYVAQGGTSGLGGTTSANEIYVVYAAVPEPGTLALAVIGLAAAGWTAARRRRARAVATVNE